ncbi:O-antigen ligase family protein [Flaviramulus sp. BrNp1-15]|uniref:O-antigen ligase family protein n=1 Tax=Flaviramulus sp. BrNp1-15 TaxID=2916754 RepID=UPI001EE81BE3|nr:O-antigen ligase family protein [Flaviramulus sp. BrNp1-15]ULC59752.1 O-antigen ligase family protein [Flaviramulus sp. BrNp1-15]
MERLNLSTFKWAQKNIFILLLLIPISIKIKVSSSVMLLPQDLLLPVFIVVYFVFKNKFTAKFSRITLPYICLLLGIFIMIFSTLLSFFYVVDSVGLLKLFKYSIYLISLLAIADYYKVDFLNKINNITILLILATLIFFIYNRSLHHNLSWSQFIKIATYSAYNMPTGFTNRYLDLSNFNVGVISNNHGIYGSYLVLISILNLSNIINKGLGIAKSKIVLTLCFINIMLLTSRETFLLIIIVFLMFFLRKLLFKKFNINNLIYFGSIIVFCILIGGWLIYYYEIELSIINKISNSIKGFKEHGGDGSINVRFNTWKIIISMLVLNPLSFFIGFGYNPSRFSEQIDSYAYVTGGKYVTVPENLFLMFTSYGGIFSLMFLLLFFLGLYLQFRKFRNLKVGSFLSSFVIGLFFTNFTGGSIIAELLMTQLGLVYFYCSNANKFNND